MKCGCAAPALRLHIGFHLQCEAEAWCSYFPHTTGFPQLRDPARRYISIDGRWQPVSGACLDSRDSAAWTGDHQLRAMANLPIFRTSHLFGCYIVAQAVTHASLADARKSFLLHVLASVGNFCCLSLLAWASMHVELHCHFQVA